MTSSPSPSAIDKMHAGEWYNCRDASLDPLRHSARVAVHHHNTAPVSERGAIGAKLAALLGCCPASTMIEAPFHCAYGINIYLGENVYFNAGCTILDTGRVTIGANSMFGPAVQIYCADHHRDRPVRRIRIHRFHPHHLQIDSPITSGLSASLSQGSCSVNIVTHSRQLHGILDISVPQNIRSGPNVS